MVTHLLRNCLALIMMVPLSGNLAAQGNPAQWPDMLDLTYTPSNSNAEPVAMMSDLGAWFGFALPSPDRTDQYGSFSGPWLMNDKPGWISDKLLRFTLINQTTKKAIQPTDFEAHSYPGRLEQTMKFGQVQMRTELIFASPTTALVRVVLINTGDKTEKFIPVWNGRLFKNTLKTTLNDGELWLENSTGSRIIGLNTPAEVSIETTNDSSFSLKQGPVNLSVKGFEQYYMAISFYGSHDEAAQELFRVNELLENPNAAFDKNTRRWTGYIAALIKKIDAADDSLSAPAIVVKSVQTLTTNWRRKGGTLHHDGIFPSVFYRGFYGFWAWDSWKQATACAWFNPALAKEQIRLMFSRQDSSGMIPDVIYANPANDNFRNTKPPLAAWAVNEIYEATADLAFVKEMLPALLRYHAWWYTHRDADGNGLCSWGSTDSTLEAANWESGMDNAIRFDEATLTPSGFNAWCMNQESPDLNGFLFAEKKHLARLYSLTDQNEKASTLNADADSLHLLINQTLWNNQKGFYCDRITGNGNFIEPLGPEGWIPLWSGAADSTKSALIGSVLNDQTRFRTLMPFPTVEIRANGFSPDKGYWRGPVWIDQAYFAISGLRQNGLDSLANDLQHQMLTTQNGIEEKGFPLYENYNPITASGLNATHFSWTAAHLILLLINR